MKQAILFTVRFHEGRYHGRNNFGEAEWPPSPARLFQALMAGSSKGDVVPASTEAALDWLERLSKLSPPMIAAPPGTPGQVFYIFVPNNDLDAALSKEPPKKKQSSIEDAVAQTRRSKKWFRPTLFDPQVPVVYCWFFDDGDDHAAELIGAARKIYQIGRGVDMAWAQAEVTHSAAAKQRLLEHRGLLYQKSGPGGLGRSLLCPCDGTRTSLAQVFESKRRGFMFFEDNRRIDNVRVSPPPPRLASIVYDAGPTRFMFDLILPSSRQEFDSIPLNAAAKLVKEVRDKAAHWLRTNLPHVSDRVDIYLVGRNAKDGDKAKRVQIVPIPSVGHEHADMGIRRIAAYVPQSCPLDADDLASAFAQIKWVDTDGKIYRELRRTEDDRITKHFQATEQHWRSVTPLALPEAPRRRIEPSLRSEEAKGSAERIAEETCAAAALNHALRHAGIDTPSASVSVQREPYDNRGVRAEFFASGTRFSKHSLWHAKITFSEPVTGPLVVGNGRFLGLGLMLPCEEMRRDVLSFVITGGLADDADAVTIASAARRAMMARLQTQLGRRKSLPAYATGHEEDGTPLRDGRHRHIAVVADLPRRRLLYIAPTRLHRSGVDWQEISADHRQTVQALEGMDILRAGPAGRLTVAPTMLHEESDPLFSSARIWESVTDYQVTRHSRRLSDEEALKTDVTMELMRRGWPKLKPDAIKVLAANRGPRGRLTGRLRLTFPTAQHGPLLIGATSHKGGGLFAGC